MSKQRLSVVHPNVPGHSRKTVVVASPLEFVLVVHRVAPNCDGQQEDYGTLMVITVSDMEQRMLRMRQMVDGPVQQQSRGTLAVDVFADELGCTVPDIVRLVGYLEAP